ncbi:MAG: sialidase family protein [Bacillota bacterium]|nr:sialidase family protein [Bacillota bacterium]
MIRILEHGVVCRRPTERHGYFGWPSIARLDDGQLVVGASGFRLGHLCPFGKTVLFFSHDDGRSWSDPRIVNDSPLDDRDVGLTALGGRRLLISWFNLQPSYYLGCRDSVLRRDYDDRDFALITDVIDRYTPELGAHAGSFVRLSADGGASWGETIRVPVSAPHGPILAANGDLLYLGKRYLDKEGDGAISFYRSRDGGSSWDFVTDLAIPVDSGLYNFHEPHLVELSDGRLLGQIRFQDPEGETPYRPSFSIAQTLSGDGGRSWSPFRFLGVNGSPPALLRHSSGTLISVFGRRREPFGQRVILSRDEGESWQDFALREDGPDSDLGYPSSVELGDGSLLTVYYQRVPGDHQTSLLWTHWALEQNL